MIFLIILGVLIFFAEFFLTLFGGVEIAKRLSENSLKETISYYFRDFKKLNFLGKGLFLVLVLFSIPAIIIGIVVGFIVNAIDFVCDNKRNIFYKKGV